jgi:hypothetical protein
VCATHQGLQSACALSNCILTLTGAWPTSLHEAPACRGSEARQTVVRAHTVAQTSVACARLP